MPPPPINTGAGHAYAPQHQQHMYGQQQQAPAPPGYPMQQQQQAYGYGAPQQANNALYGRSLAEVEGNNRSKAQLIVGIDFVSCDHAICESIADVT